MENTKKHDLRVSKMHIKEKSIRFVKLKNLPN
jgi:hypothetical protein